MTRTLLVILLILLAPVALAQTANDTDYNTQPPPDDTGYTADPDAPGAATSTTQDGAFDDASLDASAPQDDVSYLNDTGVPEDSAAATTTPDSVGSSPPVASAAPTSKTPGVETAILVGAALVVALASRRREA